MSTILLEPTALSQYNPCIPSTLPAYQTQNYNKMPALAPRSQSVSPPPFLAVSNIGMFHVMGYTPREGEQGIPLTVYTRFDNHFPNRRVFLRIIIGQRGIATEIRRIAYGGHEAWRLEGTVPDFHVHRSSSSTFTVSIQAVDSKHAILDSVTFGEFTYWDSGQSSGLRSNSRSLIRTAALGVSPTSRSEDELHRPHQQSALNRRARSASFQHTVPPANVRQQPPVLSTPGTMQILRRRDAADDAADGHLEPATLEFVTPLEDMAENLTADERRAGRRLVRFSRVQDGHKLLVSCQSLRPEDYDERHIAVSCIYRPSDGECYVTSVDIIYLLQHFVQDNFSVEEKNRIRRNLEGFRPTTISKTRAGSEDFFQQIMDFPMPKPRNIEKDVKVFPWGVLGAALDKIINKYSLFTVTQPIDDISSPAEQATHQYQAPEQTGLPSLASFMTSGSNTQLRLGMPDNSAPAPFVASQMHVDPSLLQSHAHLSSSSLVLPPDGRDRASSHGSASDLGISSEYVGEYPASHSAPIVSSTSTGSQDPYIGHVELRYPTFDSVEFQTLQEYSANASPTTYV
ncbi:hypothetical protein EVG20_g4568 [Dentipellis fragilis]|uniref:DUF7082 domain-containing protein n=1 Tax=Dentipellis fragilis TaxID=205917 RepID=A0A4Y9YW46_9AGAM|nr:hypothetical protein EVG20_g4568 [Dentipellis fragilis]